MVASLTKIIEGKEAMRFQDRVPQMLDAVTYYMRRLQHWSRSAQEVQPIQDWKQAYSSTFTMAEQY